MPKLIDDDEKPAKAEKKPKVTPTPAPAPVVTAEEKRSFDPEVVKAFNDLAKNVEVSIELDDLAVLQLETSVREQIDQLVAFSSHQGLNGEMRLEAASLGTRLKNRLSEAAKNEKERIEREAAEAEKAEAEKREIETSRTEAQPSIPPPAPTPPPIPPTAEGERMISEILKREKVDPPYDRSLGIKSKDALDQLETALKSVKLSTESERQQLTGLLAAIDKARKAAEARDQPTLDQPQAAPPAPAPQPTPQPTPAPTPPQRKPRPTPPQTPPPPPGPATVMQQQIAGPQAAKSRVWSVLAVLGLVAFAVWLGYAVTHPGGHDATASTVTPPTSTSEDAATSETVEAPTPAPQFTCATPDPATSDCEAVPLETSPIIHHRQLVGAVAHWDCTSLSSSDLHHYISPQGTFNACSCRWCEPVSD